MSDTDTNKHDANDNKKDEQHRPHGGKRMMGNQSETESNKNGAGSIDNEQNQLQAGPGDGAFVGVGFCAALIGTSLALHQVIMVATSLGSEIEKGTGPSQLLGLIVEPMLLSTLLLMIAFFGGKWLVGKSQIVGSPSNDSLHSLIDKASIVIVATITLIATSAPLVAVAFFSNMPPVAVGVLLAIPAFASDVAGRWRYRQVWGQGVSNNV